MTEILSSFFESPRPSTGMPRMGSGRYAIKLFGNTLLPRIKSGEYVVMDPDQPYGPGDEVLLVHTEGWSTIKEFVCREGGKVTFRNVYNSERTTVPESLIRKIEYVSAIVKGGAR